jgi:hypothetical protein
MMMMMMVGDNLLLVLILFEASLSHWLAIAGPVL